MAIKVRTNGQWLPVSGGGGEPVGTILMWAGSSSSIPSGFLLCDGSAISRTFYSALFTAIGTTNGAGDGSSTFNIPNLVDKFVLGASSSTGDTTYPGVSPTATGGSADAVVVSHRHLPQTLTNMTATEAGGNTLAVNNTLVGNYGAGSGTGLGPLGNRHFMQSVGEDGTNKNLPPYYALCYLIKAFNTRATAINSTPGPPGPPSVSYTHLTLPTNREV